MTDYTGNDSFQQGLKRIAAEKARLLGGMSGDPPAPPEETLIGRVLFEHTYVVFLGSYGAVQEGVLRDLAAKLETMGDTVAVRLEGFARSDEWGLSGDPETVADLRRATVAMRLRAFGYRGRIVPGRIEGPGRVLNSFGCPAYLQRRVDLFTVSADPA